MKRKPVPLYAGAAVVGVAFLCVISLACFCSGPRRVVPTGRAPDAVGARVPAEALPAVAELEKIAAQSRVPQRTVSPQSGDNGSISSVGQSEGKFECDLDYVLIEALFSTPDVIERGCLLRHIELNPRALRPRATDVAAIDLVFDGVVCRLPIFRNQLAELRDQEMRYMAQAGYLRPLQLRIDNPEVKLAFSENSKHGLACAPMFHGDCYYHNASGLVHFIYHSGQYYGAGPSDLIHYIAFFDRYVEEVAKTYAALVAAANALGFVSDLEVSAAIVKTDAWKRDRVGNPRYRWQ